MRCRLSAKVAAPLAFMVAGFALAGCGGGGPAPIHPSPVSISIAPGTATLHVTEVILFSATVSGSTNTSVTFQAGSG